MARLDRDADHPAAARLDGIAADNLIRGPVGALHQHVRLNRLDRFSRGVLVEQRDGATHSSAPMNLGALAFRRNRPSRPLVPANGSVGVQADNQRIAEQSRLLQVADVSGMQQVEDTIGEDDLLAGRA